MRLAQLVPQTAAVIVISLTFHFCFKISSNIVDIFCLLTSGLLLLERSLTWILMARNTKGMFYFVMILSSRKILFLRIKVSFTWTYAAMPNWLYILIILIYFQLLTDSEVGSFQLIPVTQVAKIIQTTEFFKPNCAIVIIDFLFRHG